MNRRIIPIFTVLAAFATSGKAVGEAQGVKSEVDDYIKQATVQVEFVIVKSTTDYKEAGRLATEASKRLHLPLKLRDLRPTAKGGLSFPKSVCEENGWDTPCYVARGRYDDGFYVSIEHTSGYPEFKPGLYVVMVASARQGSESIKDVTRLAREIFPDAYSRIAQVYMGCIH
jgi:hypothetical protein